MTHPLLESIANASDLIADFYESREFAKAVRQIMELADLVNAYVDENKPWELAKDPQGAAKLHEVCSVILESFRRLSLYLKPVLPNLVGQVEEFLVYSTNAMARYQQIIKEQFCNPTLSSFNDTGRARPG